jgi:hypothetical protein
VRYERRFPEGADTQPPGVIALPWRLLFVKIKGVISKRRYLP